MGSAFLGAERCATRRNVSLMRVCQPRPLPRKCSTTSASNRRVTDCFGLSNRGRPIALATALRKCALLTRFPPMCGIARENHSSVSSGISSYSSLVMRWASTFAKLLPKALFLTGIGFSHRDYATCAVAQRPDYYNHPAMKITHSNCARFAVVAPVVWPFVFRSREHLAAVLKVKATTIEGSLALGWIVNKLHDLM
jgi:hypothetical protein